MAQGSVWGNFSRTIRNKWPGTPWPYKVIVVGLYDKKRGFVLDTDLMRRDVDENKNPVFVCKNTGEKFIPPQEGFEDKNGFIIIVRTGDTDYKFLKGMDFDLESERVILSLHDDEQMKFLFAQQLRAAAERFQGKGDWWNSAIMALLVIAATVVLAVLIITGQLNGLTEQIDKLGVIVSNLGSTLGNTAGAVGGVKPPI